MNEWMVMTGDRELFFLLFTNYSREQRDEYFLMLWNKIQSYGVPRQLSSFYDEHLSYNKTSFVKGKNVPFRNPFCHEDEKENISQCGIWYLLKCKP